MWKSEPSTAERPQMCLSSLYLLNSSGSRFFSQKTPISPLQHGRPVHALCTPCALRSVVCLWKDSRHQRIAALWLVPRADGASCCFLSCLVESVDLPAAPGVHAASLISQNVRRMKLRGGSDKRNLLVHFLCEVLLPPGRKWNLRLPPWKQRYRHVSGNKTLHLKHEVTFLLRRAEPATSEGVKQWNGIIWSRISFFTAASGWTGCHGEQGDRV